VPRARAALEAPAEPDQLQANCKARSVRSSRAGGAVSVGGRRFERLRDLGKGSFGVVWEVLERTEKDSAAETLEAATLALKCSTPANQQMLEACVFEAEVLQQLAVALPAEVTAARRVPAYVAHCVAPAAPAAACTAGAAASSQVFVAMSKLDGKPLDQWLYGVDENRLKTISLTELLDGPLPGGQLATRDLAGACGTAAALLSQMAPVFETLSGIAYHRDVSAHNFLVRAGAAGEEFSLLDFGLAVRMCTWHTEFKVHNISGDPRYFSPAAWMLMVYGHRYLETHPDGSFLQQYAHRLDHFSLGILALEVLFALWRGPSQEAGAGRGQALEEARSAWRAVWRDAMFFFQLFHAKGLKATREAFARSQAVAHYVDRIRKLCTALRAAASAGPAIAAPVFRAAAGLVDPQGSLSWKELPALLRAAQGAPAGLDAEAEARSPAAAATSSARSPGECAGASGTEVAPEAAPRPVTRKYSHRRNWTVDEAVSLGRGGTELGVGWSSPDAAKARAASCRDLSALQERLQGLQGPRRRF